MNTSERPPASIFRPFALRNSQVIALGLLGLVYLFFSAAVPLAHTDIWVHLKYGQWMVEHADWPERELFSPFSDPEQTYGNFQWLSQVVLYHVFHLGELIAGGDEMHKTAGGVQMLRGLYGLMMALKVALLMLALRRQTRSLPLAIAGAMLMLLLTFADNHAESPQMFGEICFVFLLWCLSAQRLSRLSWLVIPLLFALWANLHPSFFIGLALLELAWFGRVVELACTQRARDFWTHPWLWQGLAACVLAPLAAGCNPHGLEIYSLLAEATENPNVRSLPAWAAMDYSLFQAEHWGYLASLAVLVLSQAVSPRTLPFSRMVVLVVFAIAASSLPPLLTWWMLLVPWFAVGLWQDASLVLPRFWRRLCGSANFSNTVVVLVFFAITLACSGWVHLLAGSITPLTASVTRATPWPLAMQLKHGKELPTLLFALKKYPQERFHGRILADNTLADFLVWSLPGKASVLVYSGFSHAHYFPVQHWQDHLSALSAAKPAEGILGWEKILLNYRVNMIVINPRVHQNLAHALLNHPDWIIILDQSEWGSDSSWNRVAHEVHLIAVRRQPLPG